MFKNIKPMSLTIVLLIVLALIWPIFIIWSANTLFPALEIPYTFKTWLAILLLGTFFQNFGKVD